MWRGIALPKGAPDAARVYWEGVMTKVNNSKAMQKYYQDNVAQSASIPGKKFEAFLANQEKLYRQLLGK
jgi:tripartite-type tricarboxylate transporter receptor subunit TctC